MEVRKNHKVSGSYRKSFRDDLNSIVQQAKMTPIRLNRVTDEKITETFYQKINKSVRF